MKKFRKVLDGLTTSSPVGGGGSGVAGGGGTMGSPSCGSAAGTPTAVPTPREIDVQETLVSENFQLCKVSVAVSVAHKWGQSESRQSGMKELAVRLFLDGSVAWRPWVRSSVVLLKRQQSQGSRLRIWTR